MRDCFLKICLLDWRPNNWPMLTTILDTDTVSAASRCDVSLATATQTSRLLSYQPNDTHGQTGGSVDATAEASPTYATDSPLHAAQ